MVETVEGNEKLVRAISLAVVVPTPICVMRYAIPC